MLCATCRKTCSTAINRERDTMTNSGTSQRTFTRTWLLWTAGFLAFPLAGLAGTATGGRVDSATAALIGGTVAGLALGVGQVLASRRRLDPRRWIPASGVGMGIGLLLGAAVVDYGTTLADLAVMGALTGLALGPAQAIALPHQARMRWAWAAAMPALWVLGWTATTLGQIHVEDQFTIFGAYGALTFSALSGVLLHFLLPHRPAADRVPASTRIEEQTERAGIAADEGLIRVHPPGLDRGTWHNMTGRPYLLRVMGFGLRAPKNLVGHDAAGPRL
jgi:hypothetical protein